MNGKGSDASTGEGAHAGAGPGRGMMIFAVRTTTGQERTVANLLASRVAARGLPVASIFVPEAVRGYIFVEAAGPHVVDEAISGLKHARGRTRGTVNIGDIEKFIVVKPVIEELAEGGVVEVVAGPFKGLRARITGVDRVKEEVTIELLEEGFAILPITVHADYVKPLEKEKGEGERIGREEIG
ncbi:transcription elongation factor Spt5 [Candidatus Bathyarchaeota archaeon]|nr:transcription elongation factor Spt5 [Candidatus Bathyarchaeota archaeon]